MSIYGGEVALKGTSNTGSKLAAQKRINPDNSKAESLKQPNTYESPSKARQIHNKVGVAVHEDARGIHAPSIRNVNAQPQKATMSGHGGQQ